MEDIDKQGIEFLNRLYKDMYKSEEVMYGIDGRFIGNKVDNISYYINRMEELHQRVGTSNRENDLKMLKEFYYRKYVIKEEDIPESYYEHQKEIYLERGYGHVNFREEEKHEMALQIINDQKKRLDVWIEYFVSNDSSYIPMWAKYWAFQGMLSLGNYDKKTKTFGKRSKGTTAPFVDLNREALALSIDFLLKVLNKESIEDKQLEVLIQGGSFGKIYAYILNNVLSKNNNSKKMNEGVWIKYNRGTDHMPLVKSLQGYNTGWCTAGEGTAKSQLAKGDFYVYYTYNEKGEAKVPRIAIRMEGSSIGEVRGVAKDQNIESEMEEVVEQKLNEFPDKDRYKKKVSDMKKLTEIYKKNENNEELNRNELVFLYEIEQKIEGFGYQKDPRIEEIIYKRNNKKDLSIIFNCNEKQVGTDIKDLNLKLTVFYGNLDLHKLKTAKDLNLPKIIIGNLDLSSLENAEGLVLPEKINGNLYLHKLKTAKDLNLPKIIGNLDLSSLEYAEGLVLPETLNGDLDLRALKSAEGLVLPETLNGNLNLSALKSANGLVLPKTINGNLNLSSLESAEGLVLPETIKGSLILSSLESAEGLVLPETIKGSLILSSLKSAEGLVLPETLNGDLDLYSLKSVEGLKLPETLNGGLYLSSLDSVAGLVLPKTIYGALDLGSLKSAEGLVLPKTLTALDLRALKSAEGLVLPETIYGGLNLRALKSAEGLVLPKTIYGALDLSSLKSAEGLVLPKTINVVLYLRSLESVEGLVLPETINGFLYLNSLKSLESVVLPEKFSRIVFKDHIVVTPENVHEYINQSITK